MTEVPVKICEAYGELPPDWKLEKLKFFASIRNSSVDKIIFEDEKPVRLCNYTDVYYNECITSDMHFMEGSATEVEIKRFQLKRGQVIITKDSEAWDDIGIPALVIENMPDVLCGYHLSVLEPGLELDGGFLAWLCRAEPLNDQFKLAANGVTRFGLGQNPMKNAFVALPPLDTQQRIAQFLNEKMARIDTLIEKKRELLNRLAEKRQALITRAVTKGLNPDVPMKSPGIDWLGDIPAHWGVLPIRRITTRVATGRTPPSSSIDYFTDGEVNWFTPGDLTTGIEINDSTRKITPEAIKDGVCTLFPQGTIFLVGIGATLGKVVVSTTPGSANQQINAILTNRKNSPYFIAYFLHAFMEDVRAMSNGNTLGILNQDGTKSLLLPIPPHSEQVVIASYLQDYDIKEADVIRKITESTRLLHHYRSALITAAVTGSIPELI